MTRPAKPRYTLPTAMDARSTMLHELRRHGFKRLAQLYAAGKVREKRIMSELGCESIRLEAEGDEYGAGVARGVALLAAFLHEGKHTREASADALRAFWAHYHRWH